MAQHKFFLLGLLTGPSGCAYSPLSCSSRGVVMGRREDGAAVGTRPEMRPDPTGSMTGEIPPSTRCGAAGSEQRTPNSRAMAGLRSQALRPAARSWLTGVAGPRSRKRGPRSRRTPPWSAGRRVPPLRNGGTGRSQDVPRACFANRPPGASQAPAPAGAPLPSLGAGNCNSRRGPARGRHKEHGRWRAPNRHSGARA